MKAIIKKLDISNLRTENLETKFDFKYIRINDLIELILTNENYVSKNKIQINDIKTINYKEKIILSMFVDDYVHLFPTISKYNIYSEYLFNKLNPLNENTLFRGIFVSSDILYQNKLNGYKKIAQIGVLPTFLEAYLQINDAPVICDFINIVSSKYNPNSNNNDLYDKLIDNFSQKYPLCNIIKNVENFYTSNFLNTQQNNYDLIIFDTYKNLHMINYEEIPSNINMRLLSSIIHAKYILGQIIFAINKLENNGDLILLLSGFDDSMQKQLITLLVELFDSVTFYHSKIDYSYRYFVICKHFNKNNIMINVITKLYEEKNKNKDEILINLLPSDMRIVDVNMNEMLIHKFQEITSKINILKSYFSNTILIKKIYYDTYYYQLQNTKKFIDNIFGEDKTSNIIHDMLYEYNINLYNKLIKLSSYYSEHINNTNKLEILFENVKEEDYIKIYKFDNYLKLINLVGYDIDKGYDNVSYKNIKKEMSHFFDANKYLSKKVDISFKHIGLIELLRKFKFVGNNDNIIISDEIEIIKTVCEEYNIKNLTYIDFEYYLNLKNKTNIFENLTQNIIIKFELSLLSPLLISIFYCLSFLFGKYAIFRPEIFSGYYYFISQTENKIKNNDNTILLIKLFNINLSKINSSLQLVVISSDFIDNIIVIINKLINKELMDVVRYKYPFINPEYKIIYDMMLRKYNKIKTRKI